MAVGVQLLLRESARLTHGHNVGTKGQQRFDSRVAVVWLLLFPMLVRVLKVVLFSLAAVRLVDRR